MRTSGQFETTRYRITLKSHNDPLYLAFSSDFHWLNPDFSHTAFDRFKAWSLEHRPHVHHVLNGDYLEWTNARSRASLESAIINEYQRQIDRWVDPAVKEFAEQIDFMRGQIVGIGEGNHGWKFDDGTNDSQMLAGLMRAPYLGVSSVIQIEVVYCGRFSTFQIYMHHGKSSLTTTTGGPINTVEKLSRHVEGVLIYAMGDNHQRWAVPTDPKMIFAVNQKSGYLEPRAIEPWLVRTGGFVKNYEKGTKSYVIDRGGGPRSLGPMVLELEPMMTTRYRKTQAPAAVRVKGALYI